MWIGHENAAQRLGLSLARLNLMVDAGLVRQREVHFHGKFTKGVRRELALEDVQKLRDILQLAGHFDLLARLESARRLLTEDAR